MKLCAQFIFQCCCFFVLVPTTSFLDLHRHRYRHPHPHFHDMMNASDCCNIWKSTFYALHQAPPRPRLRLPPAASPPPSLPKTAVKMEKICGISWGLITIKTLFCKKKCFFVVCISLYVRDVCVCVCVFPPTNLTHNYKAFACCRAEQSNRLHTPTDWHGRTTHRRR